MNLYGEAEDKFIMKLFREKPRNRDNFRNVTENGKNSLA